MKFRVERDALADAVAWVARSLPPRPPVPVLAGVLLDVDRDQLTVSGFDYEVSTQVSVDADTDTAGKTLVSGRLLADITRALPGKPVELVVDGPRLTLQCGSSRFTLPTLPVEDYPTLPALPAAAGTVPSEVFAQAVSQVAVAAGRDDTLPMLTGVRVEIEGQRITLAATDRYRLAVRDFAWTPMQPGLSAAVLVPARTLAEAAKTLTAGGDVTVALGASGDGIIGFAGGNRHTTTRLLDADFPKYRSLLPSETLANAELPVAGFVEAVKRVALVADRGTPVRLDFSESGLSLTVAGEDEGRAEEQLDADFTGEPLTIGFNPNYLLDGLASVHADVVRLSFTTSTKPAVLSPVAPSSGETEQDGTEGGGDDGEVDYRYLIMPMRLPG